jgi:Putative zinc-finger
MNCNTCQFEFDRLLDGQLDAMTADHLRSHLAACPACATAWRDHQAAWKAFVSSPELEPSSNFTARVMNSIDAMPEEAPANIISFPALWRWTSVAAAMLVVAASVGFWLQVRSSYPSRDLIAEFPVVQKLDVLRDFDVIQNLDQLAPPTKNDELDELADDLLKS